MLLGSLNDGPAQAVVMDAASKNAKTTMTLSAPSEVDEQGRGYLLSMTMLNGTGEHHPEPADARKHLAFLRASALRKADFHKARPLSRVANHDSAEVSVRGLSFLRANSEDVEMLTLDEHGCGVACHHVLPALTHDESLVPWDYHGLGKRVAMLLTIPQLNLVILGSMHGRVALLTLTKPPQTHGTRIPTRAFRVDAVLPFQSEVRQQPWVCLLVSARSPCPTGGGWPPVFGPRETCNSTIYHWEME